MLPEPTQPEDLTREQLSLVPDVPTERTATALLALQHGVAETQKIPDGQLVQLCGAIFDHGSAGVYGRLPYEGAAQFQTHIVGWFRAGKGGGFSSVDFESQDQAMEQYEAVLEKLSADV
jgi:hypothetical protein